ncbi:MAG: isocitrate lyase/PEP mutase family protein [Dehalococcoidia bacterium]|nr:isocitrate lyase/PEP mutase family protein [Dehalococcoidia bacterium]MSQ16989.1 isocitrate lyase/PEP mutase family protein [Dehalococcoidia bacterium]
MNLTQRRENFRAVLEGNRCVHSASVFDPISARIAQDLGFEVIFMAGSVASGTVLGAPDLVVLTLSEFAEQIHRICRASTAPLMVDADHGYGNALSVKRTVEELETAGVACLTIEDTILPLPFGSTDEKGLISLEEGVGKMKAALAGRQDSSLVIAARTSALRMGGIAETVRRAKAYQRVGVDALFLSGAQTREEMEAVHDAVKLPIVMAGVGEKINNLEFLASTGVRVVGQGHLPFAASVKAIHDCMKSLRDGKTPASIRATLAPPEMMGQFTRKADYERWSAEFLT